ncbi:hypothetical protein AGMMS49965_24230 [Bacteroidia bacterium]|nr:hypothetical protein AGMMS49965_24230 [Bacteroidia bacterium]
MDFKDSIKQLSGRVEQLKANLQTEEATKNALIMPFINALGYDVFNPLEVVPEMSCDIGTKKGEKIDYAIMKDGEPVMLIECKHWAQNLTLHDNQLLRYFHVSKAKFGLLTNGIIFRFYTDLETPNKMDEKPFLEIDMLELKEVQIEELKKFHKSYFDVDTILSSASELKYTRALKEVFSKEFFNPSPELVKLFAKQVYDGIITTKLLEQFTELVRKSISGFISDTISERLKTALKTEMTEANSEVTEEKNIESAPKEKNVETVLNFKNIVMELTKKQIVTFEQMDFDLEVMIKDIKDLTVTLKLWSIRRQIEAVLKCASKKTTQKNQKKVLITKNVIRLHWQKMRI